MSSPESILIIGAGQAAAMAVTRLREYGHTGTITLVGDEPHLPYERPPLSKDLLTAASTESEPVIAIKPASFYDEHQVMTHLGARVIELDASQMSARLDDGNSLTFDACLLATGGTARLLPDFPETAEGVFYLRTLDDARRLRSAMLPGKRLVVIGAGFLGLEIASTARAKALDVDVVEYASRALARVVPPEFSDWLQGQASACGVNLHLDQRISGVEQPTQDDPTWKLNLLSGQTLNADLVVVSVGLTANVGLAQAAGLAIDPTNGGITVDAQCQTSHPGIYAAGDCTSQPRDGGNTGIRLESWQNANEQARIAAAAMLGQTPEPAAYPWFWTDQFGHNIQMLGLPQPGLTYLMRSESATGTTPEKLILLGLQSQIPVNAIAVNAGGDLRALRPVLESRLTIDPAAFTDTQITVRALAKQTLAQAKPKTTA